MGVEVGSGEVLVVVVNGVSVEKRMSEMMRGCMIMVV